MKKYIQSSLLFLLSFMCLMGNGQAVSHTSKDLRVLFGGSLFLYRTTEGQQDYVIKSPIANDVPSGPYKSVGTDDKLTYGLHAGWFDTSSNSDLLLRYKHVNDSESASAFPADRGLLFSIYGHPDWGIDDEIENPDEAYGRVRYQLDTVAIEGGHFTRASKRLRIHWVAGLNYANIERDFTARYVGGDIVQNEEIGEAYIKHNSRFRGLGISSGLDANYTLTPTLSLFEEVRAGFLMGDLKLKMEGFSDLEQEEDNFTVRSNAKDKVIYDVHARLGIAYDYQPTHTYKITVLAGYEANKYFNATGQHYFVGYPRSTDGEFDGLSIKQFHDISFSGPFIECRVDA